MRGVPRKGRGESSPRPVKHIHELLVAMVIVVIPIAFGMPAVAVFVPPAVPLIPTVLPRFVQFVPSVVRLSAVPTVMLHGFVKFVVRLGDAALATIVAFSGRPRRSRECQHAQKSR